MFFLSDSVLDAKNKILKDLDKGKLDRELAIQRVLDLDPTDYAALGMMAQLRTESGDRAGAEEILWRAIQAHPSAFGPFLQLSIVVSDQGPLSKGLTELACRKILRDENALEDIEKDLRAFH